MASNKRKPAQRDYHLEQITKWYLAGVSQREIGTRLKLSQQQISYDLKKLRERWLTSALVNLNEAKSQELAKVDNLEREYWDAWERSKEDKKVEQQKAKPDSADARIGRLTERVEKTEGQIGDPRFLTGVQWCINKRCEILGLDAMSKSLSVDMSGLTDRQLERIAGGEDVWNVITNPGKSGN